MPSGCINWTIQNILTWPHSVDFNKPTKNQVIHDTWHMYLVTLGHLSRDRARLTWQGNIVTLSRADLISDSGDPPVMSVRITTNCLIHIYWPRVRVLETERMSAEKTNLTGMEGGHPDTAPHTPRTLCVSACNIAAAEFLYQNNLKLALFKWCGLGGAAEIVSHLTSWLRDPLKICFVLSGILETVIWNQTKMFHISVLLLLHTSFSTSCVV